MVKKFEPLDAQWKQYLEMVVPTNAHESQVIETRRAFHAGATAMLRILRRVGEPDISEGEGMKWLVDIAHEIADFAEAVKDGREDV